MSNIHHRPGGWVTVATPTIVMHSTRICKFTRSLVTLLPLGIPPLRPAVAALNWTGTGGLWAAEALRCGCGWEWGGGVSWVGAMMCEGVRMWRTREMLTVSVPSAVTLVPSLTPCQGEGNKLEVEEMWQEVEQAPCTLHMLKTGCIHTQRHIYSTKCT